MKVSTLVRGVAAIAAMLAALSPTPKKAQGFGLVFASTQGLPQQVVGIQGLKVQGAFYNVDLVAQSFDQIFDPSGFIPNRKVPTFWKDADGARAAAEAIMDAIGGTNWPPVLGLPVNLFYTTFKSDPSNPHPYPIYFLEMQDSFFVPYDFALGSPTSLAPNLNRTVMAWFDAHPHLYSDYLVSIPISAQATAFPYAVFTPVSQPGSPGSSSDFGAAIPEPTTIGGILLAATALVSARQRQKAVKLHQRFSQTEVSPIIASEKT